MDENFDKPLNAPPTETLRHKSLYQKYKDSYGEPPNIKEFLKEPSTLWGIQEDILTSPNPNFKHFLKLAI